MDDMGQLAFQSRADPKLTEALLRHGLLPIVTVVVAAMLALAVLLYQADDPGGWAVPLLVGGVVGPLFILFTVPRQVVTRNAHKIGGPVGYRIDAVGVHTTQGFSTSTLPWSAIKAVRRARGQIMLSHGSPSRRRIAGIPTADLTANEQTRLLAVLRSRGAALTSAPAA